jgi:hypothetical protein
VTNIKDETEISPFADEIDQAELQPSQTEDESSIRPAKVE